MAILITLEDLAPDLHRTDLYRLVARLRFHSVDECGRTTPVASGYRPDCWFGLTDSHGERLLHGCVLFFRTGADAYETNGTLWVRPGQHCMADVLVGYPSYVRDVARVGGTFEVQEGRRVVATAAIESIFDPGPDQDAWPDDRDAG